MSERLLAYETFIRVVETKSFTAAARVTGSSQSRVSKSISALEKRLGAKLFVRTTRHVTLTAAGAEFYQKARAILAAVEEAEGQARRAHGQIEGRLRVNTSALLSLPLVLPALLAFRSEHPRLDIELVMDDQRIDPVEEGVDLIVRVGTLDDSRLVTRRAGAASVGLYASPLYLKRAGTPRSIKDLGGHCVIRMLNRNGVAVDALNYPRSERAVTVSNLLLAHAAVLQGVGVALMPDFLAAPDETAGRLVRVKIRHGLPHAEISFLHPFGAEAPAKVRAFMEFASKLWKERGELV